MICLTNGELLIFGDNSTYDDDNHRFAIPYLRRGSDNGITWQEPTELKLGRPGYQPAPTELRDGRLLLGSDFLDAEPSVRFSTDKDRSWSKTDLLPVTDAARIDEASYVELDDGTLVGFGRNRVDEQAHRPSCGIKAISQDGGASDRGT